MSVIAKRIELVNTRNVLEICPFLAAQELGKQSVKGIAFLCDASPKARMDAPGPMNSSEPRVTNVCASVCVGVTMSFESEQLRSGSQS